MQEIAFQSIKKIKKISQGRMPLNLSTGRLYPLIISWFLRLWMVSSRWDLVNIVKKHLRYLIYYHLLNTICTWLHRLFPNLYFPSSAYLQMEEKKSNLVHEQDTNLQPTSVFFFTFQVPQVQDARIATSIYQRKKWKSKRSRVTFRVVRVMFRQHV